MNSTLNIFDLIRFAFEIKLIYLLNYEIKIITKIWPKFNILKQNEINHDIIHIDHHIYLILIYFKIEA